MKVVFVGDPYIYVGADNLIEADATTNVQSGSYMNSATATFTLKDSAGSSVSGATAVSMAYVSASNGKYQGILESTVGLTNKAYYTLAIDISQGGIVDHWEGGPFQAVYKGAR